MESTKAPSRLSEQLRETIAERIATAVYSPGTKLDETEMANEFGVSRTPIREALIQLASEGLVEMRPRRGAMVAATDPHRLVEMFEVMAELEAMCGALAARRATDADLKALLEAHRSCELARESKDPDRYYWCNEAYHSAIYAASHNGFLAEQATALRRRLRPYRRLQLRVRDRMRVSYAEHAGIVDAIVAGDGELAAKRLRAHVVVQGERFHDLIASLQSLREAESA